MSRVGAFLNVVMSLGAAVLLGIVLVGTITDANYQGSYTARYQAYQAGETARELARQQAREIEAQEWGETLRTWGQWGGGALAVVAVAGVGGWAVVQWQRERTEREKLAQTGRTDRRRIGAQERIILAWLQANSGQYPDARAGQLGGVSGVFLEASREFIPWQVARAELPARALLELRE